MVKKTGNELQDITLKVAQLAREAGLFISGEAAGFDPDMAKNKGLHDFVSYVDVEAEKIITKGLSEILPGSRFLTEEGTFIADKDANSAKGDSTMKNNSAYTWIVDPLDGTTNFIHGLPPYSVSIALREEEEMVAGVVYVITSDEMFTATRGGGAWLNGKRISVSEAAIIEESLVATGFPYKYFSRLDSFLKALAYFLKNTHGVRRMGSAAVDLAYVACGRFDAFFEYNLNLWDIAAGVLLVREAGGKASDFSGDESKLTGSETVAANNLLFENFRKIVGIFMIDGQSEEALTLNNF